MQIHLFDNNEIIRNLDLRINSTLTSKFTFREDLDPSEYLRECGEKYIGDEDLIESLNVNLPLPRECQKFAGDLIDSHFNFYATKAHYMNGYYVVYSSQDLLAFFLHMIFKCSYESINKLEALDVISRDLLEMTLNTDVNLVDFMECDDSIKEYVTELAKELESSQEVLLAFLININSYSTRILKYIAIYLATYTNLVFVSMDKSKIMFRSQRPDVEDLECTLGDSKFILKPLVIENDMDYYNQYKTFKFGEVIGC